MSLVDRANIDSNLFEVLSGFAGRQNEENVIFDMPNIFWDVLFHEKSIKKRNTWIKSHMIRDIDLEVENIDGRHQMFAFWSYIHEKMSIEYIDYDTTKKIETPFNGDFRNMSTKFLFEYPFEVAINTFLLFCVNFILTSDLSWMIEKKAEYWNVPEDITQRPWYLTAMLAHMWL